MHRTIHTASGMSLLLAYGICCSTAFGQDSDGAALYVELSRCIGLKSDADKFTCYQERVDAALAGREPAGAPDTAHSAADGRTASTDELRESSSDDDTFPQRRTTVPVEISGTITALRETIPNNWIITLDNGQVWQMNQPKRYPLRVGLEVELTSTRWGESFRLSAPEHGGFVQVRRAR